MIKNKDLFIQRQTIAYLMAAKIRSPFKLSIAASNALNVTFASLYYTKETGANFKFSGMDLLTILATINYVLRLEEPILSDNAEEELGDLYFDIMEQNPSFGISGQSFSFICTYSFVNEE